MGFGKLLFAGPCGPMGCLLRITCMLLVCRAVSILPTVDTMTDTLPSFSSEVTDPKYIVALDVRQGASENKELGEVRMLAMKDKHGRKFSCLIPAINATDGEETTGDADSLALASGMAADKTPSELLSMLDSLCFYRIEEWWTYELCYKKHVRQFHKDHDKVEAEFSLGSYSDEESDMDAVHEDGSAGGVGSKYVKQVYKGGEPCDITGNPRETEVHFVCAEAGKDGIVGMRETATCHYQLTFSSARICSHPSFHTPQVPVHHVLCTLDGGSAAAVAAAEAAAEGDDGAREGEAAPPGGGAEDPAMAEDGEDPSSSLEDLRQAIKEVGEGLGVNMTSLETALLNTDGGVTDKVAASQKAAAAAESAARAESGAAIAEQPRVKFDKGEGKFMVGPPAPAQRDPEEEVFYYEDQDEEDEDDFEEQDFSRSGMHAEL